MKKWLVPSNLAVSTAHFHLPKHLITPSYGHDDGVNFFVQFLLLD
jgi:hypothetical protein